MGSLQFPGKTWFNDDEQVILERKAALNKYLQQLAVAAPLYPQLRKALHSLTGVDEQLGRLAFANDVETLAYLLDSEGFDAQWRDRAGGSLLHYAAAQGQEDMTRFLLQKGLNPYARDLFGNSALEVARRRGHEGIAKIMREARAPRPKAGEVDERDGSEAGGGLEFPRGTFIPPQYCVAPEKRRLLIFVNPFGGTKKAERIFDGCVAPLLEQFGVRYERVTTARQGHAEEAVRKVDLSKIDGIVSVSGDGLLSEIMNGLARRPDSALALHTPVSIVPGGTGNGLAASLGMFSPYEATLRLLRGLYRPLDLIRVRQESTGAEMVAFLQVSWGFVSDADLGSESWRWMGQARTSLKALQNIMAKKEYIAKLRFLPLPPHHQHPHVGPDPVTKLCERCLLALNADLFPQQAVAQQQQQQQQQQQPPSALPPPPQLQQQVPAAASPAAAEQKGSERGPELGQVPAAGPRRDSLRPADPAAFVERRGHFAYLMVSNVSMADSKNRSAPFAHFSDGAMDLVLLRDVSRLEAISLLTQFETGDFVKHPAVEYVKVTEFSLEPETQDTLFDVDGERMENKPVAAFVEPGAATVGC
jgi:sphingosine kinase